jgi:hypothetical protein
VEGPEEISFLPASAADDTRLAANIAGGLAVGLLVIVLAGIFYVARGRAV